jgi:hypothetical protein|tara:strand:+ start:366 stop:902 length:537 start_codon:yes stop_codon:yes gene_type:complete
LSENKRKNKIIDELLEVDEIPEDFETPEDLLEGIAQMTSEVSEIKKETESIKVSDDPITNLKIFNEVSDLINRGVAVLDTCKEDIERSSLLDAELVSAYASLIRSTREIISDNIAIFRDRQKHIEKLELENLKQEHRKEILLMKDDLEKTTNDGYGETKVFVQEAVVELLNDVEKKKK